MGSWPLGFLGLNAAPSGARDALRDARAAQQAVAEAAADMASWLLQGGPAHTRPFSLKAACRRGVDTPCANRFRDIAYLLRAPHPRFSLALQKAIFHRMLGDPRCGTGMSRLPELPPERAWPIRASGEEAFTFSAFSSFSLLALHNLVCLSQSRSFEQFLERCRTVNEFWRQARRTRQACTLGDLLAAHLVAEAAGDLRASFREAVARAGEPTFLDRLLWGRAERKQQRAAAWQRWFDRRLLPRFERLSLLEPFLTTQAAQSAAWRPREVARGLRIALAAPAQEATRRWLAWRMAQAVRAGGHRSCAALRTLCILLLTAPLRDQARSPACGFVAQALLEAFSVLPADQAERLLLSLCSNDQSDAWRALRPLRLLAGLCSRLTHALRRHAPHGACTGEDAPATWAGQWQAGLAQFLQTALSSGKFGQLLVGLFLRDFTSALNRNSSWDACTAALPELQLQRVCRSWSYCSFRAAVPERDGRYAAVFDTLRASIARRHPDLASLCAAQGAIWKATEGKR